MRTGSIRLAAVVGVLTAGLVGAAGVAQAREGYRYWSFWTVTDNSWGYAQLGPATTAVQDGDVHGWRFGISTDDGNLAPVPRTDAATAFTTICAGTPQVAGSVRVALFIDFGTKEGAPTVEAPPNARWSCAVVPEQSTGATVLSQVAQLRLDNGFVCGIDGFPASECSVAADVPLTAEENVDLIALATAPTAAESPIDQLPSLDMEQPSGGDPLPIIIGGVVILLGLVAAWALQSRRKTDT